jgi:ubiquinone/menaquinone biosynthesis C-methylase UbiE
MRRDSLVGNLTESSTPPGARRDLVANRARLTTKRKLGMLWNAFRDNGFIWSFLLALYYLSSSIGEASFHRLQKRKLEKNLPGISSLKANKEIWEHWNWEAGGEEWTLSPEWKDSLIENVLRRYILPGGHILEIGPGAGRWTGVLIEMADTFTAVDVAESCIQLCRQKFGSRPGARFLVGSGKDLTGVADQSVDFLWSFDAFVHINVRETACYVREFKRVTRRSAVGVVHHGKLGGLEGGWRSNLTSSAFRELLENAGFEVLQQFDSWKDGGKDYPVGRYGDEITVFRRRP